MIWLNHTEAVSKELPLIATVSDFLRESYILGRWTGTAWCGVVWLWRDGVFQFGTMTSSADLIKKKRSVDDFRNEPPCGFG